MPEINKYLEVTRDSMDNNSGFVHLFTHYYPRLCLYAFQILSNKDTSEDIVQECFSKLWLRKEEIDYEGGVAAYLYSMVRNRCYNYIRDEHVRQKNEHFYSPSAEDTGLDKIIRSETYSEVHEALQLLPSKCQEIFRKLFIEGKDYSQISLELNISESTIRSQKAKALSILRRHLRPAISLIIYFFAT